MKEKSLFFYKQNLKLTKNNTFKNVFLCAQYTISYYWVIKCILLPTAGQKKSIFRPPIIKNRVQYRKNMYFTHVIISLDFLRDQISYLENKMFFSSCTIYYFLLVGQKVHFFTLTCKKILFIASGKKWWINKHRSVTICVMKLVNKWILILLLAKSRFQGETSFLMKRSHGIEISGGRDVIERRSWKTSYHSYSECVHSDNWIHIYCSKQTEWILDSQIRSKSRYLKQIDII